MKRLILLLVVNINCIYAQIPAINWQKCYGGSEDEVAYSIVSTGNREFVICGYAESDDGDVINHHAFAGPSDFWIYKIDSSGTILWSNCLGGTVGEEATSVISTFDGGYFLLGSTTSNDYDVSGLHGGGPIAGNSDLWAVKTDSVGVLIWQRCFGGTADDYGSKGEQTMDSGFVITGRAESFDGDIIGSHGLDEIFVARLDKNGNVLWKKVFGGTSYDEGVACKQLPNGNFILTGYAASNDGNIIGNHNSTGDGWVAELDPNGSILWSKCYGGSGLDGFNEIILKSNGGYYLCGSTNSTDGDVSGLFGLEDIWIVNISSVGDIIWQRCYGGSGYDRCNDAILANDGGLIIVGRTTSIDGQVQNHLPNTNGFNDVYVLKIDSTGNFLWSSCYGGSKEDFGYSVAAIDNTYLICGQTNSIDYDITSNHGQNDAWIFKIEDSPNSIEEINLRIEDFNCRALSDKFAIDFKSNFSRKMELSLFNVSGQINFQCEISCVNGENSFEFNMDLVKGIYIVQLRNNNSTMQKKIVVM